MLYNMHFLNHKPHVRFFLFFSSRIFLTDHVVIFYLCPVTITMCYTYKTAIWNFIMPLFISNLTEVCQYIIVSLLHHKCVIQHGILFQYLLALIQFQWYYSYWKVASYPNRVPACPDQYLPSLCKWPILYSNKSGKHFWPQRLNPS